MWPLSLCIRKVRKGEAQILRQVATRAYRQHYTYLWQDNGEQYLRSTYAEARLEKELADPDTGYWMAEADGKALGFLTVRYNSALPGHYSALECMEVVRIYLVSEARGNGLGKALMQKAAQEARRQNRRGIWLKMMDSKPSVRRFYEALGFEICGTTQLREPLIKEEYAGMLILKKETESS